MSAELVKKLINLHNCKKHNSNKLDKLKHVRSSVEFDLAIRYHLFMNLNPIKIFLLDDDVNFLEETKKTLVDEGYEVAICSRPTESIIAIRELSPDCLVLDLRMPLFDGEAFLPWVRRQFPDLAVIVCTGKTDYDRELFSSLQVNHVIDKPFTTQFFIDTVESAILEREAKRKVA